MMENIDKNIAKERDRYLQFHKADKDNINIISKLAELQMRCGEKTESEKLYITALQKEPKNANILFNIATLYMSESRYQEAKDTLYRLSSLGHQAPAITYNIAYCLVELGEHQEAVNLLDTISNQTEIQQTNKLLARAHHHLGDLEKGIQNAKEAIKLEPNNSEAYSTLALLLLDDAQFIEAKETAEKSLELNKNNSTAMTVMATVAMEEEDIIAAENYYSQTTKLHPTNGRAWNGLGLIHMLKQDLPTAIEHMEKSLQLMPTFIGGFNALGWAYIVNNDLDAAETTFLRANDVDANFGETHGGLAVIEAMRQNTLAAKKHMITAKRLDKNSFSAHFAESLLAANQGNQQKTQQIMNNIFNTEIELGTDKKKRKLKDAVLSMSKKMK